MYYIEQWSDGKLYCKTTPRGKWRLVPLDEVYKRLKEAEAII